MEPGNFHIGWDDLWRVFFIVLLAWVLYLARDVIAALLLAIVISSAFDPVVSFLERKRIPRILGTILIYLVTIVALSLMFYAIFPIVLQEFSNLINFSGQFLGSVFKNIDIEGVVRALSQNLDRISTFLFSGKISLAGLTSRFLGGAVFAVSVFVLSFYLTIGRDGVEKFLTAILPSTYEAKALHIYKRVSRKIGRWLTGQLFISLIVGIVVFVGLLLLGVKYSLFLGIIAAVAELVPFVGPIFTGSLAVLIGLGSSFSLGIYVFILFVLIQQLENHVLLPAVMRYTTALNPVVVLTALLIGGDVFGVVGLVLAVPIAVLFQEVFEDWSESKQSRRGFI